MGSHRIWRVSNILTVVLLAHLWYNFQPSHSVLRGLQWAASSWAICRRVPTLTASMIGAVRSRPAAGSGISSKVHRLLRLGGNGLCRHDTGGGRPSLDKGMAKPPVMVHLHPIKGHWEIREFGVVKAAYVSSFWSNNAGVSHGADGPACLDRQSKNYVRRAAADWPSRPLGRIRPRPGAGHREWSGAILMEDGGVQAKRSSCQGKKVAQARGSLRELSSKA